MCGSSLNRKNVVRWLSIVTAIFIILSLGVQSSYAAASDFAGLKGEGKSGKVKISVHSYQEKDGIKYGTPELVRIKAGERTSYVPVITNKGEACSLRLRVYAKTRTQNINILKYCYGWEDKWIYKDDWFYYKKTFDKGESVEICQGFDFPTEWKWRISNVMGITVDAEAVADEPVSPETVRTGDESNLKLWAGLVAGSVLALSILWRRRRSN